MCGKNEKKTKEEGTISKVSGVISMPMTCPCAPTIFEQMYASTPEPHLDKLRIRKNGSRWAKRDAYPISRMVHPSTQKGMGEPQP